VASLRAVDLQASLNGLKSTKIPDPPVPEEARPEEEELPTEAIISLFQSAVEVLYESGCVPRKYQLGRIGYGCELDPGYLAVQLERLSMLGLKPMLIG
jgi:hypothetical protein